jgi:hypothetical protein
MRRVKAGKGHSCAKPVWMAAMGRHSWHLALEKRLAKGRYRLLTRAVQSDELAEASFGKRDHNRITFRVR